MRPRALSVLLLGLLLLPSLAGAIETQRLLLRVEGMVCPLCAKAVQSVLREVEGVISAEASLLRGEALISYDPARVKALDLVEAINTKTPYRASLPAVLLKGGGKEPLPPSEALKRIPGVEAVEPNPPAGLLLRYNPAVTTAEAITAFLREKGYEPLSVGESKRGWGLYLAIAGGLGALLLVGLRLRPRRKT